MNAPIKKILGELYQIDPSFKKHAKELQTLIEKLLKANPNIKMNAAFSADLRKQLVQQAKALKANNLGAKGSSESGFGEWVKRLFFPFTGGILAALLVIAMINPQLIPSGSDENEGVVVSSAFDSSTIAYIDRRIVEIDEGLTSCVKTEIPLEGQSTEGGLVTFYHKPIGLQKMKEEHLGETGKTINKYFYDHGELIHVIHEVRQYNRPIYWDKKKAEESGDNEIFDEAKTTIKTSVYYFEEDGLVRWVDEAGKSHDIEQDVTQALQGEFLLNRSAELIWLYESKKD